MLLLASLGAPWARAGDETRFVIDNPIVVTSFDGTRITATLMLPEGASEESPVPVLLKTNGWGTTRPQYPAAFDAAFLEAGYAVFAWDSRGFGESGGRSHWNAPDYEVRDVQVLLDYLSTRPEIAQDGPGDPRVGWVGGSYAGGIQWNTAAADDRLEAITPRAAGGDIAEDMVPNGVYKFGIFAKTATKPGRFATRIEKLFERLNSTFRLRADDRDWLERRSSRTWVDQITTPTLVLWGTIDQAFPLQDALVNYKILRSNGVPVKFVGYCGGHGELCPYPGNDVGDPDAPDGTTPLWVTRMIRWLDRYVQGRDVATGPAVEWMAQDGYYYGAPSYPLPKTEFVAGRRAYTGPLDGPADRAAGSGRISTIVMSHGRADRTMPMFGRPKIILDSKVTGGRGYVFLSLIDRGPNGSRETIDLQTVPVTLRRGVSKTVVRFNAVAWMLERGHAVDLKITTGTAGFRMPTSDRYEVSLRTRVKLPLSSTSPEPQRVP